MINLNQINLGLAFSIERVLAARGFNIKQQQTHRATLLNCESPSDTDLESLWEVMHDPLKRLELQNKINNQRHDHTKISSILGVTDVEIDQNRFATSLEWYFGELMVRSFGAFSSGFGIELSDNPNPRNGAASGDYDVLAVMGDSSLAYIECKSGGIDGEAIIKATDRGNSLFAIATIVTLSYKTELKHLQQTLDDLPYPGLTGKIGVRSISLKDKPESKIYAWHDTFFLPRSTSHTEAGLRTIFRLIALKRVEFSKNMGLDDEDYPRLGFDLI